MKGSYARVVWTHRSFAPFHRAFEAASAEALAEAGEMAAEVARHEESRHVRTGATQRGIGWAFLGKGIALFVKTLQGVFIEYGTKERQGPRGSVQADPYLRPAMIVAGKLVPGFVARKMRGSSLILHRVGGGKSWTQTRNRLGQFGRRP